LPLFVAHPQTVADLAFKTIFSKNRHSGEGFGQGQPDDCFRSGNNGGRWILVNHGRGVLPFFHHICGGLLRETDQCPQLRDIGALCRKIRQGQSRIAGLVCDRKPAQIAASLQLCGEMPQLRHTRCLQRIDFTIWERVVPEVGLEPTSLAAGDFESPASTIPPLGQPYGAV
jgi:hypothetical protein